MKKLIQIFSILCLTLIALGSCQDENLKRFETPEIKLDKTELNLTSLGAKETIKILAGVGEMTVTSSDEKVAIATLEDKVITVTAKGVGEAIITIKTAEKTSTFKVVVTSPDLAVKEAKVELAPKVQKTIEIVSGTEPITLKVSDEEIATAEIKDGKVIITAKTKEGKTTLTLTDASGKTTKIELSVKAPELSVKKGKEEVNLTVNGTIEVEVVGGTEPVTVKSSDDTKVIAELKDGKVLITAKAEGSATITLTDTNAKTATIKVTVAPAPELKINRTKKDYSGKEVGNLEFIFGDSEANRTVTITSGTAPYQLIQKDVSDWSDPSSTVDNVTLDQTVELPASWGDKKYPCKAGTLTGNTIVINAKAEVYGDVYIIRDAAGKELEFEVNVKSQLAIDKKEYKVLIGQTVNDMNKIAVTGLAERISIKSNSNETVVEASIEESQNSSRRALILKGISAGKSTITITDGVVDKTVEITVVAPDPITIHLSDGTELADGTAYEVGKFIIKGGTGKYNITVDNELIKTPIKASEIAWGSNKGFFDFNIERNMNIALGGEVNVTVTNANNPADKKTFKVTCPTLLEMTIKVNGKAISKVESSTEAYYSIEDGFYAGYQLRNLKLNDVIEFTVKNGSGAYKLEQGNYGKDQILLTENGNNEIFTLTVMKAGTYYGDVTITDKANDKLIVKVTRIYTN